MAKKIAPDELKRLTTAHEEFVAEFGQEGDRACAILGVAKLDSLLYQILSKVLRPDPAQTDSFLEGVVPLSSFSAQIDCAHRLGLVASDLARALHLVRRIRNDFAHEAAGASLNSGSHRDRVMAVARSFAPFSEYDFSRAYFEAYPEGAPREFRAALSVLVARLTGALHRLEPLDLTAEIPLVPPQWNRRPGAEDD